MPKILRSVIGLLVSLPSIAVASDPTPLFVLFVGVPFAFFAIVIFAYAWYKPISGKYFLGFLLLLQIPVIMWASDVGYMDVAGEWLIASMGICVVGMVLAVAKEQRANADND